MYTHCTLWIYNVHNTCLHVHVHALCSYKTLSHDTPHNYDTCFIRIHIQLPSQLTVPLPSISYWSWYKLITLSYYNSLFSSTRKWMSTLYIPWGLQWKLQLQLEFGEAFVLEISEKATRMDDSVFFNIVGYSDSEFKHIIRTSIYIYMYIVHVSSAIQLTSLWCSVLDLSSNGRSGILLGKKRIRIIIILCIILCSTTTTTSFMNSHTLSHHHPGVKLYCWLEVQKTIHPDSHTPEFDR